MQTRTLTNTTYMTGTRTRNVWIIRYMRMHIHTYRDTQMHLFTHLPTFEFWPLGLYAIRACPFVCASFCFCSWHTGLWARAELHLRATPRKIFLRCTKVCVYIAYTWDLRTYLQEFRRVHRKPLLARPQTAYVKRDSWRRNVLYTRTWCGNVSVIGWEANKWVLIFNDVRSAWQAGGL